MLLAEIEIYHNRPITPTRRIALGQMFLPVDPAPGFGGLLLSAIVAGNMATVDDDLLPDVARLVRQIGNGQNVVQPRLRHRYQVDRLGLAKTTHRLVADGEHLRFELADNNEGLQQVLGAVYAVERFAAEPKRAIASLVERAMRWNGSLGPSFVAYLGGVEGGTLRSALAFADPVAWALDILSFPAEATGLSKREVSKRFRDKLRDVHPDHGAADEGASELISDLAEARRILTS